VRLAAKLTGWKIDIKSEEEKRREVEIQLGALEVGEAGGEGPSAGDSVSAAAPEPDAPAADSAPEPDEAGQPAAAIAQDADANGAKDA
jgi:transcription antitermination factor NusA-like protein